MRVTCPCCQKRFDVSNREVLAMAARLAEQRKGRNPGANVGPDVDGNVLRPEDAEAKRLRDASVARRMQSTSGGRHGPLHSRH